MGNTSCARYSRHCLVNTDKAITITRKLVNPAIRKPDGSILEGYEYQRTLQVEEGIAAYCTHYTLEYEWEAVPGTWRFSILLNDKEILHQDFELYQ